MAAERASSHTLGGATVLTHDRNGKPRSATVWATEPATLLRLDPDALRAFALFAGLALALTLPWLCYRATLPAVDETSLDDCALFGEPR